MTSIILSILSLLKVAILKEDVTSSKKKRKKAKRLMLGQKCPFSFHKQYQVTPYKL